MKKNRTFFSALIFAFALAAAPAFSQGLGVGVGGQAKGGGVLGTGVGAGAGAGAAGGTQAGAGNVGVRTRTDVQAKAPADVKTGASVQSNNGIATKIESDPQLSSRVQAMLPAGSSMAAASAGFKNQGQFISALHASQNLNIPFDQLKTKMTGSDSMSLGAAIHASKPEITEKQAKDEAKKAEIAAKETASAKASASATAAAKTSVN